MRPNKVFSKYPLQRYLQKTDLPFLPEVPFEMHALLRGVLPSGRVSAWRIATWRSAITEMGHGWSSQLSVISAFSKRVRQGGPKPPPRRTPSQGGKRSSRGCGGFPRISRVPRNWPTAWNSAHLAIGVAAVPARNACAPSNGGCDARSEADACRPIKQKPPSWSP
jgi:hypothetical protein